jgi:hypothetical protein
MLPFASQCFFCKKQPTRNIENLKKKILKRIQASLPHGRLKRMFRYSRQQECPAVTFHFLSAAAAAAAAAAETTTTKTTTTTECSLQV